MKERFVDAFHSACVSAFLFRRVRARWMFDEYEIFAERRGFSRLAVGCAAIGVAGQFV